MDDLISDFIAECRDMLEALGGEIVAWEADPGDRRRLDSIFRFVHTVKGNCGFFEFPRLEALSHAAEGALAEVRSGHRVADAALVNAVLAVIDRIGEMVAAIDAGEIYPEGGDEQLIDALAAHSELSEMVNVPTAASAGDAALRPMLPQRTIRLSVELLDHVMSGVSDMVLARNDLARHLRGSHVESGVESAFDRLSGIIAQMRDAITRTRMQRVESLFSALPRLVRDVSSELHKQVMIDIESGDVELDREMIEMIRDPLTHIIRNAIDHGIEAPAERRALGKREIGLLTVTARQSGNQILIDIADDGRGIDGAKLVEKAIGAGIIDSSDAAKLRDRDRHALIFHPGLSTARAVSAISGRGVGMDVVRSNVERIGGVVEVDSAPGQGTRITLRVPLTLSIISALTISIGGQQFAIPRSTIVEIVQARAASVEFSQAGDAAFVTIRDQRMPCLALAPLLQIESIAAPADQMLIVVRSNKGHPFAALVDRIHDHEDLVVKPVAPTVMAAGVYAGSTLADDGTPILLLDAAGLAQVGGLKFDTQDIVSESVDETATERALTAKRVLQLLGLNGQRRAMPMAVIERITQVDIDAVERSAGQLRAVVDGRIISLVGCEESELPEHKLGLLLLSDGQNELAYAFAQVFEMAALTEAVLPADLPGEVEGVTLIDGEQFEVIDPHWLFAHFGQSPGGEPGAAPVCRVPSGDPWVQNLLRPLIESAGYRVIGGDDEASADVAIVTDGQAATSDKAEPVIRLRSALQAAEDAEGSIYRYDRAGLMIALETIRTRKAS